MSRRFRLGALLWLVGGCGLQAQDRFFDSAGVRIRYTVEGQGEPVVLIHGLAMNIEMNWTAPGIIRGLAERYQVTALDNRGHGRSQKPHDPAEYGTKMADDVIRLMDHLGIRKAHVVGYSLGGRIAGVLLARRPERLRTVTIGGAGWMDAKELEARRRLLDELAESLEHGQGLGPLFLSLTPPGQPRPAGEQVQAMNQKLLSFNDPLALAAVVRESGGMQPSAEELRASRLPALALAGELDPLKAHVQKLKSLMPHLKVVVIPGANHISAMGTPEFLSSLRTFLAEHADK